MVKRFILSGLLIVAVACGDDDDAADPSKSDAAVSGSSGSGGSSTSSAGSSGSSSSSSGGSGTGGTSSGTSGSPASGDSGTSDPGTAPTDGSQLARCENDDDCGDGLNCYEFGGYCSAACATDADCASLGAGYTCNARAGGGMQGGGFPGGGMQGDAAAPEPNGTCRAQCTGETDTSCPSGLTCRSAGGGFMGGGGPGGGQMGGDAGMATGTFRCGYEPVEDMPDPPPDAGMGTDMPGSGTTGAFQECEDDDECADGLECTGGGRGGSGYCAQSCEEATDCAMQPGSGSAELTCGFGGTCSLSCAEDGQTCPDGMTCVRAGGGGGGGGGFAFCGFAAQGGNPGGGNGPGGGGP